MSWKDKLKNSQGGESNYPQFLKKVELHLEIKLDKETNKIGFKYYDRETETTKFLHKPIIGVLVGASMRASAFDPNLGRNGGELNTSAYFTNQDKGVVFGFGQKEYEGTIEACCDYLNQRTNALKKKKELYILTEKGTLVAIKTSVTLAIVDIDRVGDLAQSNFLQFTAREYVPEEHDAKTHKFLGKFASTNRPKYTNVTATDTVINDEFGENTLSPIIDLFNEFKEFTMAEGSTEEEENLLPNEPTPQEPANFGKQSPPENLFEPTDPFGTPPPKEEPTDDNDLPF